MLLIRTLFILIVNKFKALETLAKANAKLNETQIHYNAVKQKSEEIRGNLANDVRKAEQNLTDAQ